MFAKFIVFDETGSYFEAAPATVVFEPSRLPRQSDVDGTASQTGSPLQPQGPFLVPPE